MSATNHEKDVEAHLSMTPPASGEAVHHHEPPLGLRSVALLEFGKGILFLLLAMGAFTFHGDIEKAADTLIRAFHLDPTWQYSETFIRSASHLTIPKLRLIGMVAAGLAVIRMVEGYFLWHEKPWAEWFAVISSGIYLPIELHHYYNQPSTLTAVVYIVNLTIVVYLGALIFSNRRAKAKALKQQEPILAQKIPA